MPRTRARMRIADHVFVVTGGGNGIGREVVLTLLRRGASVAAVDVSESGLATTVDLAGDSPLLSTHAVDLTDAAAVGALVPAVLEAHGRVDGVLNVAGIIQPFVPISEVDPAVVEKVMAVNFWAVVHVTKAFLPVLQSRPRAALVNVSSMGAFVAVPGQTAYGASKAAVKLLTEGLWAELRGTPVRVTAVYPGGVATDIAANSGATTKVMDQADSPMRLTTPQSAAEQIVAGMERGAYRVVIGKDARALDLMSRASPRWSTALVARRLRSLVQ